jgi:hypothetical protein
MRAPRLHHAARTGRGQAEEEGVAVGAPTPVARIALAGRIMKAFLSIAYLAKHQNSLLTNSLGHQFPLRMEHFSSLSISHAR